MRILIVDDEVDVQMLFRQRFRKEIKKGELDLQFALSGQEAIDALNEMEEKADLILSDINMPGMSGLELLEYLKQRYAVPPPVVMMISAYGDQSNMNSAKSLGADDFFTKPLDFKLLKEKLKTLTN